MDARAPSGRRRTSRPRPSSLLRPSSRKSPEGPDRQGPRFARDGARGLRRATALAFAGLLLAITGVAWRVRGSAAGDEATPEPIVQYAPVDAAVDAAVDGAAGARLDAPLAWLEAKDGEPLESADAARAAAAWMDLVEDDPPALLPAPADACPAATPADARPRWRVRELALLRLAALPPDGVRAVEERWGGRARSAAELGSPTERTAALERAAAEAPVTEGGAHALLALAERDLELGAWARAVGRLRSWLRHRPGAPSAARAGVVARLADGLAELGAEADVAALRVAFEPLLDVPVRAGARTTPLRAALTDAFTTATRVRRAVGTRIAEAPSLPADPVVLYTRPLGDEGYLGEPREPPPLPFGASVATDDAVFVGTLRRVLRLDPATGRERWSFPARASLRADHAPSVRHRAYEMPVRGVALAGDAVVAVLGDPPVAPTARYRFGGRDWRADEDVGERRARLVALDADTGALRWLTGAIDETHAVLGAADVGVASAPLVDGGLVYAVFSARRGAVESWLACLEVATGRPRWVCFLGRGESGLERGAAGEGRTLAESRVRSIPAAERPAIEGGEVVVAPGTGYLAAVDREAGRLRWLQPLPRRVVDGRDPRALLWGGLVFDEEPRVEGSVAWRAPTFAFGAWHVLVPGAPFVASVSPDVGGVRRAFAVAPLRDAGDPTWPTLLQAGRDAGPHPSLWVVGPEGPARRATLSASVAWTLPAEALADLSPGSPAGGRPWVEGRGTFAWRAGHLVRVDEDAVAGRAPRAARLPVATRRELDAPPRHADVVRAGDVWLLVGADRVTAIADRPVADRIAAAGADDDAEARALRLACAAARRPSPGALRAAATAAAAAPTASVRHALDAAAAETLDAPAPREADRRERLELLAALSPLAPDALAAHYARAAERWSGGARRATSDPDRTSPAVEDLLALEALAEQALALPDPGLAPLEPGARHRVRLDLLARTRWFAAVRTRTEGVGALARREADVEARTARERGVPAARASARDRGTATAFAADARALARAIDEGRDGDAAALCADLRLDPPDGAPLPYALAAALRAEEGERLARLRDLEGARDAAGDAVRASLAPAFALDGRPAALAEAAWADASRLEPTSDVPTSLVAATRGEALEPGERAAARAFDATRAVEAAGPGADALAGVLLVHPADVEVRPLDGGDRRDVAAPAGAWFGATVTEREPFVPGPGILVLAVEANSPADLAGVRVGDWIVAVNGAPVDDVDALRRPLGAASPRDEFACDVVRAGRATRRVATLARRPIDRFAEPVADRALALADGSLLLPAAGGAVRVRPDGTARVLRAHDGPGEVASAYVVGGDLLLVARGSPLDGAHLTLLDGARDGATRWRATLPGPLAPDTTPRRVGSAVVLDLEAPAVTAVLDAADGRVRALLARFAPAAAGPSSYTRIPPQVSADAMGEVVVVEALLLPAPRLAALAVSSTTAASLWRREFDPSAGVPLRPPLLAGASVAAVVPTTAEIHLFAPDVRSPPFAPPEVVLRSREWNLTVWGAIDEDTRALAAGDAVYLLRSPSDRAANAAAITLDRPRIVRGDPGDPYLWHPPQPLDPPPAPRREPRGRAIPVLAAARATPDGVWVTISFAETTPGAAVEGVLAWLGSSADDRFVRLGFPMTLDAAPRLRFAARPVVVGARLLVPVDDGYAAVPIARRPFVR